MRIRRRFAAAGMTLLLSAWAATVAVSANASPTTATTHTSAPAVTACGNSVVASMPLKSITTNQASWNYGYVQLWYNSCSGENWARVVSLLGNTSWENAIVYNTAGVYNGYACGPGPILTSGNIYSPVYNAGAAGQVVANGVTYLAEADQAGASSSVNVPDGLGCV